MIKSLLTLCLLLAASIQTAHALITDGLIMVRSEHGFPETMSNLQEAIKKQGYTTSRVQHVDIGLTANGYQTDKYRIVFFGKADEIHRLVQDHSEFIPYLPLKIAIFAEGAETIVVTSNPLAFIELYPGDDLEKTFRQWQKDLVQILKSVQIPQ